MRYLTFALAKGRLAKNTLEILEKIGITCEEMKDKDFRLTPKDAMSLISLAKNDESLPNMNSFERGEFERIYNLYQDRLVKDNLLDFDDLILQTIQILKNYDEIREKWQSYYRHILIDEFQDTNELQYELINNLLIVNYIFVSSISHNTFAYARCYFFAQI